MNLRYLLPLAVALCTLSNVRLADAQGTEFSYQGFLTDHGAPANGVYDLQFTVYDALTDGNRVGVAVDINDLAVSNGLFTVTIDPGDSVFTGKQRWLNIGVRPGEATGRFADLAPRQALAAAPYAIRALSADTANTANSVSPAQSEARSWLPARLRRTWAPAVRPAWRAAG